MNLNIIIHDIDGEGYLCIKLADLRLLKRSKRFTPPSIEEVAKYCKERKNGVDPFKWWNFYNSKGWKVGKEKMVDWQSAVHTWEEDKPKVGTNLGGQVPDDYGVASKTARPMSEDMKKRLGNIGKT